MSILKLPLARNEPFQSLATTPSPPVPSFANVATSVLIFTVPLVGGDYDQSLLDLEWEQT